MKSQKRNAHNKALSLNKTTITKLQKTELKNINAGKAVQFDLNAAVLTKTFETCGYICGDCKSMYRIPIGDTKTDTIVVPL